MAGRRDTSSEEPGKPATDDEGEINQPRSPITAVVLLVVGIALTIGIVDAMVLGGFSPVQQVRAKYFGSTGTITDWDCHAEWYTPSKGEAREVLVCQGSFHGYDGVTIDRVQIYHPPEEELDRLVPYWVVGPGAEWAFASVEWLLVVLMVFALPIFLGFSGFLAYAGAARLWRGKTRRRRPRR